MGLYRIAIIGVHAGHHRAGINVGDLRERCEREQKRKRLGNPVLSADFECW
jgi:hypothetical protein